MSGELLLDTGPLVALLDRSEGAHARCVEIFRAWSGVVVTTEAVLTEATHLLRAVHGGANAAVRFVTRGGALVLPYQRERLERVELLLGKYADVPMGYADATLVAVAEELATDLVFTLDRRGFEAYRWGGRRPFRILPARAERARRGRA